MGEALQRRIQQSRFESPMVEAVLNLIVAADHIRQKMDEICEEFGITNGQYNVLRILRGAHPHGHPRCEIIRRMLERAPDVTRLVDRLEAQGLVARDRSDQDRRLSITRITQQGLDLLERMDPRVRSLEQYMMRRVTPQDCVELSRICEGIYADET